MIKQSTPAKKHGYKLTSLGWIPVEWGIKKFYEVAQFFSGGTPSTSKKEYYSGDIPFIKSGEIYYNQTEQFISEEGFENSSAKKVKRGDLLYALYGANSGEVAISKIDGAINQAILCIRHNQELNTVYLLNFLTIQKLSIIRNYLQGGQGNLSAEIVKSLPILLPPLPEQKAIAKVLSTWDEAISKTQELITQKELRKKWLNRKLFNFENLNKIGKAEIVSFENHFKIIRSYAAPRDSLTKNAGVDSVYCIHYGDIHAFYANEFLDFAKQENIPVLLKEVSLDKEDLLRNGDIIMADASEDIEGVAELVEVINIGKKKAIGGLHTIVFRQSSKKFIPRYIAYLFNTNSIRNELRKKSTGTSVYSIGKSTLNQLKFLAHSDTETQIRVVKILEAADKEIELLKTKLESLKEQKKGLMQVLLSGKKRIKKL